MNHRIKIETGGKAEEEREDKRIKPDEQLYPSVEHQPSANPVGDPAEKKTAEGQTGHKGRQNCCNGISRGPEAETEKPGPDDLIHETGSPGEEETKEDNSILHH